MSDPLRIGIIGVGAVSDYHHVPGIRIDPRAGTVLEPHVDDGVVVQSNVYVRAGHFTKIGPAYLDIVVSDREKRDVIVTISRRRDRPLEARLLMSNLYGRVRNNGPVRVGNRPSQRTAHRLCRGYRGHRKDENKKSAETNALSRKFVVHVDFPLRLSELLLFDL